MTVPIKKDALTKISQEAQKELFEAMLAELIERKGVQDADLFTTCFWFVAPEDGNMVDLIEDFTGIAGAAFQEYHTRRKAEQEETEDGTADDSTENEDTTAEDATEE